MKKIESDQTFIRIIGRRKTGGITPGTISQKHMDWMDSMNKSIKLCVPKGTFRYKSHEEANADMERWLANTVAENLFNEHYFLNLYSMTPA